MRISEAQAYVRGWHDCMAGVDGRGNPFYPARTETMRQMWQAWQAGFEDCMEAGENDEPLPEGFSTEEKYIPDNPAADNPRAEEKWTTNLSAMVRASLRGGK